MSRINDVGGVVGFPTADGEDDVVFHADWEAHVYALNQLLLRRGVYNLDEFRDAVERIAPPTYLAQTYYERWFTAITMLLAERGVATADELAG